MDWAEGYYTDQTYTFGYYHELGPGHLRFACLAGGFRCAIPEAPTCLELGMGQGVSVNLHAAASRGAFWGVDFNPAHVVHAGELGQASGADLHLADASFAEFALRPDLPEFDVIALHGVWSWVSEANRAVIVDLIRRRLRPGGVVYLSYNCLPGWAAEAPVRHLLDLGRSTGRRDRDGPAGEVQRACAFVAEVAAAQPNFFADNPGAAARAARLAGKNQRYLAHEYLNSDWHLPYFSEVANTLAGAKLTFVASARPLDWVTEIQLRPDGLALLETLKDPILRESVRDYLVNQRFRADVFVKGPVRLSAAEQEALADAQAFVLVTPVDEIEFNVSGALGRGELQDKIYRPLCEALAGGAFRPKTTASLIEATGLPRAQVLSALTVLAGKGDIRPARPADAAVRAQCERYNRLVLDRAVTGLHLKHLAAPVVEGGVRVSRSTQLFLRAWLEGARTPEAFALSTWRIFERTNERAVKNDQEVVTREDNLAVLQEMAERFLGELLPLLRALEILPVPVAEASAPPPSAPKRRRRR